MKTLTYVLFTLTLALIQACGSSESQKGDGLPTTQSQDGSMIGPMVTPTLGSDGGPAPTPEAGAETARPTDSAGPSPDTRLQSNDSSPMMPPSDTAPAQDRTTTTDSGGSATIPMTTMEVIAKLKAIPRGVASIGFIIPDRVPQGRPAYLASAGVMPIDQKCRRKIAPLYSGYTRGWQLILTNDKENNQPGSGGFDTIAKTPMTEKEMDERSLPKNYQATSVLLIISLDKWIEDNRGNIEKAIEEVNNSAAIDCYP
jgi:hypothetical protein